MKLTRQSVLTASSLLIGGFIGASALVALADSTWTAAPNCGAAVPCSNTPAPINAGGTAQAKSGHLVLASTSATTAYDLDVTSGIGGFNGLAVFGNLQALGNFNVSAGSKTVANTVLANDGTGNASWVATSTLGFGSGGGGSFHFINPTLIFSGSAAAKTETTISLASNSVPSNASAVIIQVTISSTNSQVKTIEVKSSSGNWITVGLATVSGDGEATISGIAVVPLSSSNNLTYKVSQADNSSYSVNLVGYFGQ